MYSLTEEEVEGLETIGWMGTFCIGIATASFGASVTLLVTPHGSRGGAILLGLFGLACGGLSGLSIWANRRTKNRIRDRTSGT